MPRRVGRPFKQYVRASYTEAELQIIYKVLKKTTETELIAKVKKDLSERKRMNKAYERLKAKLA